MVNVCWSKPFHLFHNPLKKGGRGVYANQTSDAMSDLALANVEALAQSESSGGYAYVYYPQPGDPNYGYTKCVCSGSGNLSCC